MKWHITVPAMLFTLVTVHPVSAADMKSETEAKITVKKDEDGNYTEKQSRSSEVVDAAGTKTTSETEVKVESDADGDAKRTVTTETTTDPKGLLNKSTTSTKETTTSEDGKVEKKYKREVDGETVEEKNEDSN